MPVHAERVRGECRLPEKGESFIIHPDGTTEIVRPKDGKKFTLAEMQSFVGGLIEPIPYASKRGAFSVAYCNEEGRLEGLPPNPIATLVCASCTKNRWQGALVGSVFFKAPGA